MRDTTAQPIAVPTGHRRLQLVYSDGRAIALPRAKGEPIQLRPRHVVDEEAAPMPAWDAHLEPIIRRVIRVMTDAHPSTLIEELLGPLRQLQLKALPDNTDDLVARIALEINVALPHLGTDRAAVRRTALRWLARMETNGREPARQQYRELLSLLG